MIDGSAPQARLLLLGRALRALVNGFVAVLLPAYLLALGLATWQVGLLSTATLLGSALLTLAVGAWGHRVDSRRLLLAAGLLMAAAGLAFAGLSAFWPLLVAFVGTINPGSGDVSVFLPLEHARLAHAAQGEARTLLFASMAGALFAAIGALAAGVPAWLAAHVGLDPLLALRGMFALYAVVGVGVWLLDLRLPRAHESAQLPPALPPCRAAWPPHSDRPWLAPCSAQAGWRCRCWPAGRSRSATVWRCWRRFAACACRVDGPRQGTHAAEADARAHAAPRACGDVGRLGFAL